MGFSDNLQNYPIIEAILPIQTNFWRQQSVTIEIVVGFSKFCYWQLLCIYNANFVHFRLAQLRAIANSIRHI